MKLDLAKRIALCTTMFGLVGAVTSHAIVDENQRELDIIVRDFPVTHPDFENFQEEAYNSITNGGRNNVGAFTTWNPYPGFGTNQEWFDRRANYALYGCGNTQTPEYGVAVGVRGYPHDNVTATGFTSTVPDYVLGVLDQTGYAWYGEFKECQYDAKLNPLGLKVMRGLVADLCSDYSGTWAKNQEDASKSCNKICKQHSWSQIVYTTPGMVQQALGFELDAATGERDMYKPIIAKNRNACDNQFFDQWYTDVDGINLRTETTLILDQDPAAPLYFEIDKNWNNGGYFPLDTLDANGNRVIGPAGPVYAAAFQNQFGPQSLSIFCPPYDYRWASSQTDYMGDNTSALCEAWKAAGGPRSPDAANAAAGNAGNMGLRHLRNYGFTMMGYAAFKYKKGAGEVFKFTGDDDMWIFVDGVLVVDLGGTHLAAAGTADMDYLSSKGHGCHPGDPLLDSCAAKQDVDGTWLNESWHHLHFFYADRQSDGSNLRIRSSLSELAPSRFGQPAIGTVIATLDSTGIETLDMLLNTTLDANTVQNLINLGSTQPAILVMRTVKDPVTGAATTKVYGYYITSVVEGENQGASGVKYTFTGVLKDENGEVIDNPIVVGGDKIAFNFPLEKYTEVANDEELKAAYINTVGADVWNQMLVWSQKVTFEIKSSGGKPVVGFPDGPDDWAGVTFVANTKIAPFVMDSTIERPDFSNQANVLTEVAKSNDGELPLNYTADMLITSIPESFCQMNPTSCENGSPLGLDNDAKLLFSTTDRGGKASANTKAYVGGKESATATCFSDGTESCFSIAYPIAGPFRINVRVFDHLGHFVSQYQQSVDATMLEAALGKGTVENNCVNPRYGETGAGLVSIKMYPVSQKGRLVATGPYIYQVTFVQEEYMACVKEGTSSWDHTIYFTRTTETYRRGYKRAKTK